MLATTKELADALQVHPQTIRRMVARGEIPSKYVAQIGSDYRFHVQAIEAYLLQKKPTAPQTLIHGAASKTKAKHLQQKV